FQRRTGESSVSVDATGLIATGLSAKTARPATGGRMTTLLPDEDLKDLPRDFAVRNDRRAVFSWYLFDWATQPVATMITTFVFATYFANVVATDEVTGQSQWGWTL